MLSSLRKLKERIAALGPGSPFVFLTYVAADGRWRVFCGDGDGVAAGAVVRDEWLPKQGRQSVLDLGKETPGLRARVAAKLLMLPHGYITDDYQKELHDEATKEERRRAEQR